VADNTDGNFDTVVQGTPINKHTPKASNSTQNNRHHKFSKTVDTITGNTPNFNVHFNKETPAQKW
jgi:hypothetical protein